MSEYNREALTIRRPWPTGGGVIVKVKVNVTLEQATKAQTGSRCIALLFLQPRC